jgi:hypothetical protein
MIKDNVRDILLVSFLGLLIILMAIFTYKGISYDSNKYTSVTFITVCIIIGTIAALGQTVWKK